jgi:rSAM/selenodomain-associated transferase 1
MSELKNLTSATFEKLYTPQDKRMRSKVKGRIRDSRLDDRCLLFFVKSPKKGRVKSRLASVVGKEAAVKFYKRFILDMLSTLKRGNFAFYICFYPGSSLGEFEKWLGRHYHYVPQNGSDLGERMKNSFMEAFSMDFKRVVLIGSDIPDLPLEYIEEAFKSLDGEDVVIGPSFDGGYYLIGFNDKNFSSQVFEGIPWGTESVFNDTMKTLRKEKLTVHTLPHLRDIDTIEDLKWSARPLQE